MTQGGAEGVQHPLGTYLSAPSIKCPGHPTPLRHLWTSSTDTRGQSSGWGGGLSRDKLPADRCVPSTMQLSATRHYSSLWKQGMLTRHGPLVRGLRGPDGCPMPLQVCQTGRPEGRPATQPDCPETGGEVGEGVCRAALHMHPGRHSLGKPQCPPGPAPPASQEEERCSPRSTGPQWWVQGQAGRGGVLHQPLHCDRWQGASTPQTASAAQNQEMAVGAGRRARTTGNAPGWRKRAQEARLAPAGAVYPAAPPPSSVHFHFLPASPAGAAYLTDRLRPSELTSQARTGCCGGKAITPLSKNKTKTDRHRLALLPRTSPRRGWGWIEASEALLGRDSRRLPPSHLPGYQKGQGETAHSAPRPLPPQTPCALSLRICNREHTSRPHDREGQTELYLQIRGRIPGCRRTGEGEGSEEVPNSWSQTLAGRDSGLFFTPLSANLSPRSNAIQGLRKRTPILKKDSGKKPTKQGLKKKLFPPSSLGVGGAQRPLSYTPSAPPPRPTVCPKDTQQHPHHH